MDNIIESAAQITPQWLTTILQQQGHLSQSKVIQVKPVSEQVTFASKVWHLDVEYCPHTPPTLPCQLFLKYTSPSFSQGNFNPRQTKREIFFYQEVGPAMNVPFMIPCYSAAFDEETNSSFLLLKDISNTHREDKNPFTANHCEMVIDALAQLHAFWWDHPRLGVDVGEFRDRAQVQASWDEAENAVHRFLQHTAESLDPKWRSTYQQVVRSLPHLYQRHETRTGMTLAHGDAHLGNFLFPKASSGDIHILDWQFWHPTLCGTDLAFLMATDWEVETRQHLQDKLLQRYYQQLTTNGVSGYSWEDCWNDYRLSVILVSIFIPVWRWVIFQWDVNYKTVENTMTAFDELNCRELLT